MRLFTHRSNNRRLRQAEGLTAAPGWRWVRPVRYVSRVLGILLLGFLVLIIWPTYSRYSERALFVFPNGDVFRPGELHDLDATYYIQQFAEDPPQLLSSGNGTVRVSVTLIRFCLQGRQNPFTNRWTYRFLHDDHHNEEWEVVIERGEIQDIRVLPPADGSDTRRIDLDVER